jgi:hypothetical protein
LRPVVPLNESITTKRMTMAKTIAAQLLDAADKARIAGRHVTRAEKAPGKGSEAL